MQDKNWRVPDVNRTRLNGKIAKYDMIRCFSKVMSILVFLSGIKIAHFNGGSFMPGRSEGTGNRYHGR
nr:MAG TPA: hypothetical protein [Caudoviricetes sp.]